MMKRRWRSSPPVEIPILGTPTAFHQRDSSRKILAFIPLPPFLCLHPRIQDNLSKLKLGTADWMSILVNYA